MELKLFQHFFDLEQTHLHCQNLRLQDALSADELISLGLPVSEPKPMTASELVALENTLRHIAETQIPQFVAATQEANAVLSSIHTSTVSSGNELRATSTPITATKDIDYATAGAVAYTSKTILGKEQVLSDVGKIISTKDGQKIIKLCNIRTYGRKIYSFTYEMHSSIFDFKRIEKKLYKLGFKKESDQYFSNGKVDVLISQRTINVTDKIIYDILQKERISHNNEIKSDIYD